MSRAKRFGDLIGYVDHAFNRQHAMFSDHPRDRFAVNELHRKKEQSFIGLTEVINGYGVNIVNAAGIPRLAFESCDRVVFAWRHAGEQLDCFGCLNYAHETGQNSQHSTFRARGNKARRWRLGIQAAIARPVFRGKNAGLAFKA